MVNKPCENKECPVSNWMERDGSNCLIGSNVLEVCKHYHSNKPLKMPVLGRGYRHKESGVTAILTSLDENKTNCIRIGESYTNISWFRAHWEEIDNG